VALYESVLAEQADRQRRLTELQFSDSVKVTAVAATAAPKPRKPDASTSPDPSVNSAVQSSQTATPKPVMATAGSADVHALIDRYAGQYGLNPEVVKKIAQCESGMRPEATNGPYGGMFQFVSSTWSSNRRAMGLDPDPSLRYNAEEAIKTATFKMSRDGYGAWPACSRKALASI
jgi:soluble lytic murein transglycosylase-like protein